MKLVMGYMKEDSDILENRSVLVDDFSHEDGIEFPNLLDWFFNYKLNLPNGYNQDDIVIMVES